MAPVKKLTPDPQPAWVAAMIKELQQLRADTSTNRNMLNQLLNSERPVPSTSNQSNLPSTSSSRPSHGMAGPSSSSSRLSRAVVGPSSLFPRHNQPQPIVSRQRNLVTRIHNQTSPLRPCWYHRQFGIASTSCISPCSFDPAHFIAPAVIHQPPVPVAQEIIPAPVPMVEENIDPPMAIDQNDIAANQMAPSSSNGSSSGKPQSKKAAPSNKQLSDSSSESDSDDWNHGK